jgi:hypothetical protein
LLLESTLNRRAYIVSKDGRSWRGANQSSARRRSNYLHHCDRALLFALFYDNFIAWGYPVPRAFQFRWLRLVTLLACALVPMKIELINAKIVMASQAMPALRSGRLLFGCAAPLQLMLRRLRMAVLLLSEGVKRISGHSRTLALLQVETDASEVEQPGPTPHVAVHFRRARPRLA